MNTILRKAYGRISAARTSLAFTARMAEMAYIKASSVHLTFPAYDRSDDEEAKLSPFFGKKMPDFSKHIDFTKLQYYRATDIKTQGLLNAGIKLDNENATGEFVLVYRHPTELDTYIKVPESNTPIQMPTNLPATEDFAQEGVQFFDMSLVPAGVDLFVFVSSDDDNLINLRSVDLKIEFSVQ